MPVRSFLFILLMLGMSVLANAAPLAKVDGLRTWQAPDHTRVVFDLSKAVDYRLFSLDNPARLVIDIKDARRSGTFPQPAADDDFIKGIRGATRNHDDLRIVLDLRDQSTYKSFLLKPYKQYGDRLVIDLYKAEGTKQKIVKKTHVDETRLRDIVVAIDAGHGGEDPGARGRHGTYEKDVVLAIARRLADAVDGERGMRAVMIRKGDYYLSLRERTELARKQKADLFISIHADSFNDRRVHGASVYILSSHGASDEAARWLAESENSADLIGGVRLDDKDNMLASVLLDLSQNATIESSYNVAEQVLRALRPLGKLHKHDVQQAGFVVLKAPDIPSMLIETAFISNPDEERKLRSRRYQAQMSNAILKGIRSYFTEHAPPGTLYASRRYTITAGDTLSEIAQHYRVSVASLRHANRLSGDTVRVGQVLRIPRASDS